LVGLKLAVFALNFFCDFTKSANHGQRNPSFLPYHSPAFFRIQLRGLNYHMEEGMTRKCDCCAAKNAEIRSQASEIAIVGPCESFEQ